MKLLFALLLLGSCSIALKSQNVFNPNDAITRYDKTAPSGSLNNPNTSTPGLQKWVSTPTNGVSTGSGAIDVSSFKQYFLNWNGTPMAFRLKFPKSFSNADSIAKKYPVMLFLHGAGEVGCPGNNGVYNNEKQLYLGGGLFRDFANQGAFDGFLLYPQMVNKDGCWGAWGVTTSANFSTVIAIIDSLVKYVRADIDRVVCNGLSGGGYGAWRMADLFPQRIAKIIPSAAAGNTSNRTNFVHIPIWFATGGKDPDPSPAQGDYAFNRMKEIGADVRYTRYPELGHAVWYAHWREPDYAAALNDVHKANPLVFFQRNAFCANEIVNARLGITQGFYAYEWQKDGITIATRTNGINIVLQPEHVISYNGNEINVKSFGVYRVRFKRSATSEWSQFSSRPAIIKLKTSTVTPPITISGAKSNVLPALDGSTMVPLQMPAGFINYQWYRVADSTLVATSQTFNAPVGTYIGRYSEQYGCGTAFSPNFIVTDANGNQKPDPATNLVCSPTALSVVKLTWQQGNGETAFEVYRGNTSGGPYTYLAKTPADAATFYDSGVIAGSTYYYVVRAISAAAASLPSNEGATRTLSDVTPPSGPSNLAYCGSTSSTVALKWNAATDNAGIKRYDIYANGIKMFSTTATSFNVFDLDSLKSYNFTVKAVDISNNESVASNQVTGYTHRQGLNYKYYLTPSAWSTLQNYDALAYSKSGITDSININNPAINSSVSKYAFLWEGFIYIPVSALYTFETRSDDGSKVYIDAPYSYSAIPLVNNDSVHGIRSKYGTTFLTQGYHKIAVTYFQGTYGYDMEVWWTNNAGLLREKISKNFFTFLPAALEPAPNSPNRLSAAATAFNKISLTWDDLSSNETGFEIVRSSTSTGTYAPAGVAAANSTSFIDSGLLPSKPYFYKIRAVGASSESVYTTFVTATTPGAPLTPLSPSRLSAMGAGNSVSLTWQDNAENELGFRLYRSTDGILFIPLATTGPNSNAFTDGNTTPLVSYYYYVVAYNGAGEGSKSNIVQIIAGNKPPVLSALDNVFAKAGQHAVEDFVINDDPGDTITVKILNKPAFVNVARINGSDYRLSVDPTNDNVGQYDISLIATDNSGSSTTAQVSIVVADPKLRSIFINLGATGKTAPLPWNNWLGNRSSGNIISNLKDEAGLVTSVSLTTLNAWTGTTVLGHVTGNNAGAAPDAVLESGLTDNATTKTLRLGGLSPSKKYNIEFLSSQNEGLIANAQYSFGTQLTTLDARYNTSRTANLNNLTPDPSGQITVNLSRISTSLVLYLNGLVIQEVDPSVIIQNPSHLYVEPTGRNSAFLTWSDRCENENAVDGYQIQRAKDSLFSNTVTYFALAGNTTQFADSSLMPNTKYWYRVRAKNDAGVSDYSNKFYIVTPSSIVAINFNSSIANAPSPWNNLEANPLSEFIVDNLINQAGSNSGLKITCTKVFNGEFTAGANTGNNSGVVPDAVMMANFWLDNSQVSQMKISGLNHSRKYRIGFVGSSSAPGWTKGNYTAAYSISGKTVYLNSWMNSTKIVYINDVSADANGELLIDFSTTAAAQWAFNAGIIVMDYSDLGGASAFYMSNSVIDERQSPGLASIESNLTVKAYPNPFLDILQIDISMSSTPKELTTSVYDLTGRLYFMKRYEGLVSGRHILHLAPQLPGAGVYILTVRENGNIRKSMKIIKK